MLPGLYLEQSAVTFLSFCERLIEVNIFIGGSRFGILNAILGIVGVLYPTFFRVSYQKNTFLASLPFITLVIMHVGYGYF